MPLLSEVIGAIDEFLEKQNQTTTSPGEVSPHLEKKGILKDSATRPGLPLRKLLRKGLLGHAFQDGTKWIIPHSGKNQRITPTPVKKKRKNRPQESSRLKAHKLTSVAQMICSFLEEHYERKAEFFLEYKPGWLLSYPSQHLLKERPEITALYSELIDGKLDLADIMQILPERKLRQKQSYDIWIGEPYNFAVEFDEKQHFNQYRKITLRYYDNVQVNYSLPAYEGLMEDTLINPGSSGFTKLKSSDPLFPELLPGEAQDNRIRQRAFRDYLKDVLPLANSMNPTLRIPFHAANSKIKDFDEGDLLAIKAYIQGIDLRV